VLRHQIGVDLDVFESGNQCNQCNRTPSRNNDVIRVNDAIIEEVSMNNRIGYVTIAYGVMGDFRITHINLVVLIVTEDTRIRDKFGRNLSFRNLRKGMIVDAEFSTVMTMSNPPQSNAFRITVVGENEPFNVTVGNVLSVDTTNNFLFTGRVNNINSVMRFVITDATRILDRRGNRISLRNLRPGQTVRVEHATFQTPSIPPQTTAFQVQVI